MITLLILAMAGATYLDGLRTPLQPSEAEDLGILISAIDTEKVYQHPYPLFLFEVEFRDFDACKLTNVGVIVFNEAGQQVFGSTIGEESGQYHFQLFKDYLINAELIVTCDAGPDALDPSFVIDLGHYDQSPN